MVVFFALAGHLGVFFTRCCSVVVLFLWLMRFWYWSGVNGLSTPPPHPSIPGKRRTAGEPVAFVSKTGRRCRETLLVFLLVRMQRWMALIWSSFYLEAMFVAFVRSWVFWRVAVLACVSRVLLLLYGKYASQQNT